MTSLPQSIDDVLTGQAYAGYTYSYPHKSAYRPLQPRPTLREVWRDEPKNALFLYIHIPFCEFRCGFCNLFTLSQPLGGVATRYLHALREHAASLHELLTDNRYVRLAIGGGTPTFLSCDELEDLFALVRNICRCDAAQIPVSCEASPATIHPEKLALLKAHGVTRLSLGIQTFDEAGNRALGRPQDQSQVEAALAAVHEVGFETLNLDLIYGAADQPLDAWMQSVRTTVTYQPQEIYLYPLYVRHLTGLGKTGGHKPRDDESRLQAYRLARDELLESGYRQISMRMFQRHDLPAQNAPEYCCQRDGMIGLGTGARSYTRRLHYSSRYAVRQQNVNDIIEDYIRQSPSDRVRPENGIWLDDDDLRRRTVILSLLQANGLWIADYRRQFSTDPLEDLPELQHLLETKLIQLHDNRLQPTSRGLERADAIGPWLYSARVRHLMERYEWS